MNIYEYVSDSASLRVRPLQMLDREYLKQRARLIDMKKAQDPIFGTPPGDGTVYLTAADASGMMVSYIQSNFSGFGSGVVVEGTGISLQNRGYGFSLKPGHANVVAPRKRPFQTIIPAFVTKSGKPVMSYGVNKISYRRQRSRRGKAKVKEKIDRQDMFVVTLWFGILTLSAFIRVHLWSVFLFFLVSFASMAARLFPRA